jgi:CRISPR/Cas system CSM-associated protein Csm5 (group 7 of RAMP superfamily)
MAVISKKDESDLFKIANEFGIRHPKKNQKQDYDKAIWYNWMFYYYLATIHACLKLIKKDESQSP